MVAILLRIVSIQYLHRPGYRSELHSLALFSPLRFEFIKRILVATFRAVKRLKTCARVLRIRSSLILLAL